MHREIYCSIFNESKTKLQHNTTAAYFVPRSRHIPNPNLLRLYEHMFLSPDIGGEWLVHTKEQSEEEALTKVK